MTPIWITGFEHGLATPVTSGGGLFDLVSGTPVITGVNPINGTYSLRCNPPSAAQCYVAKNITGSPTMLVAQFNIRLDTFPAAICSLFHGVISGVNFTIGYTPSGTRFFAVVGAGSSQYSGAISTGVVYRITVRMDSSATTGTIDWQVDGSDMTQTTYAITSNPFTSWRIGQISSTTGDSYFDDLVISVTSADYPITPCGVSEHRPNADGTHNNATDIMEDSAGNDIDGVTYFAFDKLDEDPWTTGAAADYVRQTATELTKYCEVQFADTAEATILGVMAILQYASATATSNNGKTYIRDSNGQETTLYSNDMSETTAFYKSVIVLTPSGGWTQAHVNALRARFGYSGDAAPDPYWLAMILEVAYGVAAGNTYYEAPANSFSSTPACAPSTFLAISPSLAAFVSTPVLARTASADLLGSIGLASTPSLSRAAAADFFSTLTLPSNPAASMMGGMDLFNALTFLSGPAAGMAHNLGIFPSLTLLSNPALSPSALADFYTVLTLASTPAAVMAAIADFLLSLSLASNPAWSAIGGSDFYNSVAFSSAPALAAAVFKAAFPSLSLASVPALSITAQADLLASILAASSPGFLVACGFDFIEALILASGGAIALASELTSGPIISIGAKRAAAGMTRRAIEAAAKKAPGALRRDS